MKISLDFELEYDVTDADQVSQLVSIICDAAHAAKIEVPAVHITKVTQRVAGFYPDQDPRL